MNCEFHYENNNTFANPESNPAYPIEWIKMIQYGKRILLLFQMQKSLELRPLASDGALILKI